MEEDKRLVRRLKTSDEGLDLFTKHGRHFRIIVCRPTATSDSRYRNTTGACHDSLHLPQTDWETLVDACESMLQYLKSLPNRDEKQRA